MKKHEHEEGELIHIWQPGNMTRYELVCTTLKKGTNLFVWVNAPSDVQAVTKLAAESTMPAWWFLDRMTGIGYADAAAILAFLRDIKGYTVTMPTGFNEDGLWEARAEACGR